MPGRGLPDRGPVLPAVVRHHRVDLDLIVLQRLAELPVDLHEVVAFQRLPRAVEPVVVVGERTVGLLHGVEVAQESPLHRLARRGHSRDRPLAADHPAPALLLREARKVEQPQQARPRLGLRVAALEVDVGVVSHHLVAVRIGLRRVAIGMPRVPRRMLQPEEPSVPDPHRLAPPAARRGLRRREALNLQPVDRCIAGKLQLHLLADHLRTFKTHRHPRRSICGQLHALRPHVAEDQRPFALLRFARRAIIVHRPLPVIHRPHLEFLARHRQHLPRRIDKRRSPPHPAVEGELAAGAVGRLQFKRGEGLGSDQKSNEEMPDHKSHEIRGAAGHLSSRKTPNPAHSNHESPISSR
jgi:hypothetical protein